MMDFKVSERMKKEKKHSAFEWVNFLSIFLLIQFLVQHFMNQYTEVIDGPIIIFETCAVVLIVTMRFTKHIDSYAIGLIIVWLADFLCAYYAFWKFYRQAVVYAVLSNMILIHGQLEMAYTRLQGYSSIILQYVIWMICSSQKGILKEPVQIEVLLSIGFLIVFKLLSFNWHFNLEIEDLKVKIELENTECNLNSLLQAIPEGILVLDSNHEVKMMNSAYKNFFKNWETDKYLFKGIEVLNSSTLSNSLQNKIEEFWRSENKETVFGFFSHESKQIECTGTKIQWNCELSIVITFRDVSTLFNLIQEKNQTVKTLNTLRGLSHELKTPLNIIINSHLEALDSNSIDKKTEGILRSSLGASYILLYMLRDIIDYSYIKMNNFQLRFQQVNISSMLKDVISKLSKLYNMSLVTIIIDETLPTLINIDKSRIHQTLVNIISTSLQLSQSNRMTIKLYKRQNTIKFRIKFNTHYSDTTKFDCSIISIHNSLRLKMAKKIIKKLTKQDLIMTQSNLNAKIGFSYELPTVECSYFQDIDKEVVPSSDGFVDILIVDDIELNLKILKRLIEMLKNNCSCGNEHKEYSVELACSGKEAIEKVVERGKANSGYRMVFMDCQMPEMDGWEATKELIRLSKEKVIPYGMNVIAYSAFDSSLDLVKCKEAGMKWHISKPCIPETLCGVIRKFLQTSE